MGSAGEGRMALLVASIARRTLRSFPWQRFAGSMAAPRSIGEARLRMQRATEGQKGRLGPQRRARRMFDARDGRLETRVKIRLRGRRCLKVRCKMASRRIKSMEGCNVERYWCVLSRFTNSMPMCSYARRLQEGCVVEGCRGAVLRNLVNFRKQECARGRVCTRKRVDCRPSRMKPRLSSERKRLVSLRGGLNSGKRSFVLARFVKAKPAAA